MCSILNNVYTRFVVFCCSRFLVDSCDHEQLTRIHLAYSTGNESNSSGRRHFDFFRFVLFINVAFWCQLHWNLFGCPFHNNPVLSQIMAWWFTGENTFIWIGDGLFYWRMYVLADDKESSISNTRSVPFTKSSARMLLGMCWKEAAILLDYISRIIPA